MSDADAAYKAADLDLKAAKKRTRKCLKCEEPFESEWVGNRICDRCKKTADWRHGTVDGV